MLIQEIQTEVKFTDNKEPLCNKTKKTKEILPFVTTYNTYNNLATPNLKKILVKHWDIIQQQPKPGLLIGRGKKVKFCRIFRDKFGKISRFCRNFQDKLHWKAIGKKWAILCLFSGQISLVINWFCTDQTSVFNVFLKEVIICSLTTICSRNEPMAKPVIS